MTAAAILVPACPTDASPLTDAPLPFHPDKRTTHAILQRLISPDYDLADIAACFRITLMDLMDWLELPNVILLIKRLERHTRRKARLAARASGPLVIRSLRRTLNAFMREDDAEQSQPPVPRTGEPDPKDRDRVLRAREAVRKAAALLERMAKSPARRRPNPRRAHIAPSSSALASPVAARHADALPAPASTASASETYPANPVEPSTQEAQEPPEIHAETHPPASECVAHTPPDARAACTPPVPGPS